MELKNNEPNSTDESKYSYSLILAIAREHNFDLYEKLNIEDDEIQKLPENERISMLLCKEFLPEMVKNLFEIKDTKGNFKTEKGIKTLTNTIKESPSDPLVFIAKLAQDSLMAAVDANSIMSHLMPRDFLENIGSKDFNKSLIGIVLKRAPDVYQKYMRANKKTRIDYKIANLHFR